MMMRESHTQMFLFFVHLYFVDSNGKRTTFWKPLIRLSCCRNRKSGICFTRALHSNTCGAEGVKLRVSREPEVTKAWRELNKIPDSDALEAPINKHPIEDERPGEQLISLFAPVVRVPKQGLVVKSFLF